MNLKKFGSAGPCPWGGALLTHKNKPPYHVSARQIW